MTLERNANKSNFYLLLLKAFAQSAGAVEYTDCISAEV